MKAEFVDFVKFEIIGGVTENTGKDVTIDFQGVPVPYSETLFTPAAVSGLAVGDRVVKTTTYARMRLT